MLRYSILLAAALASSVFAQDDPLQAVVDQAATLDAAPVLGEGTLELDAAQLAAGAFIWIEVKQDGLYALSQSVPGALVLGSFPNSDGRYDGQTKPAMHGSSSSLDEPPQLGPLLLSSAHPYLLSASSQAGAGSVALELIESAPGLSETPAAGQTVSPGSTLFAASERLDLTLPGDATTRRFEVIGEARARLQAQLDGQRLGQGGRYPWLNEQDARVSITATAGETSAPPLILVRISAVDVQLDETEPNEKKPNPLNIGQALAGHLLVRDEDRFSFSLDTPANLELSLSTPDRDARYSLQLITRTAKGQENPLWLRKPDARLLEGENLSLEPGDYELVLDRVDGRDVPMPYSLTLATVSAPPAANREVEPNDTPASAMTMPDSLRVSASATADDMDMYRFSVPNDKAGHLWRVFTVDATRVELSGDDGKLADVRASGRRTTVDALALDPGEFLVSVRAEGDYMLRIMDLGPRPSDYEGEPNDSFADGQRLEFGSGIRGGYHAEGDIDYYLFRLDSASPVEIKVYPAQDGRMDAKLFRGTSQLGSNIIFEPGDGAYVFRSALPAGDWALALRALDPVVQGNYELTVERLPALDSFEPDDAPLDAIKLPRDGDFAGSVGAFDPADQVFVPLPQGEGVAAMVCSTAAGETLGRTRFYHWSDSSKVADVSQGIGLMNYDASLGGAVRFGLEGARRKVSYECSMRFPRTAPPPPVSASLPPPGQARETDPESESGDSSADNVAIQWLAPGHTGRAVIFAEGSEPRFALDIAQDEIAFVNCRDIDGEVLLPDTLIWQLDGASAPTRDLFGDLQPVKGGAESFIKLSRMYASRHGEGTLPLIIDCTLYGLDDLPRPSDMGPPAELRVFEMMAKESAAVPGPAGPPPPGLEALISRQAPNRQPEGDLPLAISLAPLPDLAGFSEAGQRFSVQLNLSNEGDAALAGTVSVAVSGEGWRVQPEVQAFNLAANATASFTAQIEAPPWVSPSLSPNLVVRADAGDAFSAAMTTLSVMPDAVPVGPFAYWHAPQELRGGLNVLHYGLGARLIDWGGSEPDEKLQKNESALHDGLAPHINSVNVPKDIAFRLAARTALAGVMIQLRSTSAAESWPSEFEVYVPDDTGAFQRIGAQSLKDIHGPQYLVFDQPVTTDRLRFVFPRCQSDCRTPYVQDIQAIAVPGTHPDGLPNINAADPELGGHVVWTNNNFGGTWNNQLLIAVPTASNGGWPRAKSPRQLEAVVAFHQNRAALVERINWVADPDDTGRIAEARVEASLNGPNGPWEPMGRLPSPALGELLSELVPDQPVWARYLRFSFDAPVAESLFGPDAIEVIEAPGTSVLGLWEDDQPRAAFEATFDIAPQVPVPPAGGPSLEEAVVLPVGTAVPSSVVIERNEDWWRLDVPDGNPGLLRLKFDSMRPVVSADLSDATAKPVALEQVEGGQVLEAVLAPGSYHLRIYEPPRSVVIAWDTSGSVASYIPRTLAAVRTWGRSLQPGRDALQLLPFRPEGLLLEDWAETPEALEPALRALPEEESSASELAMYQASEALADRRGARGIVIMTDAETGMNPDLWPVMLEAMPRVVSLSVDSNGRENAAIMMDWAALNGGRFQRVIGPLGLADGMEMANALFRAPKAYTLTASLEELVEPVGEAQLSIQLADGGLAASGAVELILDASGSMLQRMEGRRRIDIAHEALTGLVSEILPEGMPFAFRAFGLEEDACRSELIVPLGPLDRAAAAEAIAGVPAINLAKTAIADSLLAAGSDLAEASPPRVVVLVTDGEETCEGDPEAAIAQLRESGLDARVNIVGFAIDDAVLAETFAAWADTGGGTYFDARGAEALEESIADALQPRFDITRKYLDGRSEVVARVALGETITVPAGKLIITPGSGASGKPVTLQVEPGQPVNMEYDSRSGLRPPSQDAAQ